MTPHQLLVEGLLALTGVGLAYHLATVVAAIRFGTRKPALSDELPPVAVLKPVRGVDPDAYENFASFCRQDYPDYEILFGVQDPADPAIELIQRLQREFPDTRIRLVVSDERIGYNLKVCNLHNLLREAQNELLVISDSDMRVRPDYLRQIASYFADPQVGLVTSPYCGAGASSPSAALEALGMTTDFFPGVAVAAEFAAPSFGLGSTLALRRSTLIEVGGFFKLADFLADDFQLGNRVAHSGRKVVLSRYVVDTVLPNVGFRPMFQRRLRWMRTVRACQPAGYAGSVVTYSTFWALALLLVSGFQPWAWAVLALQQGLRAATGLFIGAGVLRNPDTARWLWMLPASDLLNFALWAGGYLGNTVVWRGDRYRLTVGGRMVRLEAAPFPAPSLAGEHPPA